MGRYRNPILAGCHPDPSLCRVGEEYFLVTSTFEYLPGLPIHRSTDLVDWELIGHAIERPGQLDLTGLGSSRGLFAPTIRHHRGRFHVVCTVVAGEGPDAEDSLVRAGHFVVTATDPRGPWSDPVWLEGVGGIDPSLVFDGDRVWLCGTRLAAPGRWPQQTEVWLRELDAETFAVIGAESVLWHGALEGAVWAEGPHLYPREDGGWMLLASEGGTFDDHAVSVAYADEITGPYRGDPGNPRLTHRDLGAGSAVRGVGHADLVEAPDGRTWAVLLASHAHEGVDSLLGRQTHLVPVGWDAGRPVFAPGHGRVALDVEADGVPDQRPRTCDVRDRFSGGLSPEWTGVRRFPGEFAEVASTGVLLRAGDEPSSRGDLGFLGRRLPASRVRVSTRVALRPAGHGALRGGLLLRLSEAAYLELAVGEDGIGRVMSVTAGEPHVVAEARVGTEAVALVLEVDGFDAVVSIDGVELATVDLRGLSPAAAGSFVGCWVGPFAVGEGALEVAEVAFAALP